MEQDNDSTDLAQVVQRLEEGLGEMRVRLDRSERAHRRLRRIGLAATVILISTFLAGAALIGDQVTRLVVVGPNNDPRINLEVNPATGSAGIEILGTNGRRVLFLGTSANGTPNLAIYDALGVQIVREVAP
jgi:hypothetical protein